MSLHALREYCTSDSQRRVLDAYIQTQSQSKTANALGMHRRTVERVVAQIKYNAAQRGYAPGHWENGSAPGYGMAKVTVQRGAGGEVERTWERQTPLQMAVDAITRSLENFSPKPFPRIKQPRKTTPQLLTFYTLTDFHLGMYAWSEETGDDWDTAIASRVMMNAINDMAAKSPDSETAILNLQGDFLHWDGLDALTPQNRHVLDADTRIGQLIDLSLDCTMWAIEALLKKHKQVRVYVCEGNHDPVSSKWLAKTMDRIFTKNPRVDIDKTEFPFYAYLHGQTMIAMHHGHKLKNKSLPALFASEPRFREMWGQATYTYIHTGHYHQSEQDMAEAGGAIVERHPTLAARDAYSARGGYVSRRAARAITYDKELGEVSRITVVPR